MLISLKQEQKINVINICYLNNSQKCEIIKNKK